MANLLPENEIIEFENQQYLNPQVALDESTAFIDNLRNVQDRNNAEINAQTRNLGTAIPSNLGGLVGGEGYFTSRYQTPQSVSLATNLRAAAQAQALNDVLSNELAAQKQRYNNAYRSYRRRAARRASSYGGGYYGGGNNNNNNQNKNTYSGEPDLVSTGGQGGGGGDGVPPNPDDYKTEGQKQNEDIQNRVKQETGTDMPEWLINALKIFG